MHFSKVKAGACALLTALLLTTALPSMATAPEGIPDELELPAILTIEEMDAISRQHVLEFSPSANSSTTATSSRVVATGVTGSRCYLDPGVMWVRKSGTGYAYGTVGSKPRMYNCTLDVKKTGMHSEVWQFNGWFWFKASKTFNSYGTGNMQQKSVQHICTGRGSYLYKVITTAWGTNSKGQTGSARDSTDEFRYYCG